MDTDLDLDTEVRTYLEAHRVGHLATADRSGQPHLVPVTFALTGNAVVLVIDEKPKRTHGSFLKRMRNIRANPQVAFLVDDYDEDWNRLSYILMLGRAEIVDSAGPVYADALARLAQRYAQYRCGQLTPGRNPVVRISPVRVHRWQAADVAHVAADRERQARRQPRQRS